MNLAMKWLAGALLTLALLVGIHDAVAAEPPAANAAAVADPATWGVYAQLPGTEWKTNGGVAEWQWGPDNSLVETRSFMMKTVIRPGANPGELVSVYGGGLHTYDGRIAADGTVLWIRRGRFLKMPSRVSIVDGELIEEMVKLDDANQVAKVGTIVRFGQTAGPKVASVAVVPVSGSSGEPAQAVAQVVAPPPAPTPTPISTTTPSVIAAAPVDSAPTVSALTPSGPLPGETQPAAAQIPLDAAQWGAYAQLIGHSLVHANGEQRWRRAPSGEAVLREILMPDGTIVNVDVIEVVGPSLLGSLRSSECHGGVCSWVGQVGANGVVTWKEPNAAGGGTSDRDVWVEGSELVDFWKSAGGTEELYALYPHLRPAPRRYPLTISAPITEAQKSESDRRTAGLEGTVATVLGRTLAQQQAQQQADAIDRERRRRSQERVRSFNRAMGSLNGVLTQANDVATANEAASRASLDATLAQINAQAEAQRQAQAEAQRRAQQQAAEEQRRQLAENARWVAEKEQAAAEYRAGQTQAAAAREAQLASQQREVEQRRATAAVDQRNAAQAATVERQRTQAAARAERARLTARPVTAAETSSSPSSSYQSSQGSAVTPVASGPIEMFVFFINLDGKTVAFEGPTAMTRAEGKAMQARLQSEAPGRYGAGAIVDARSRGGGWCAFVYQRPGEAHYIMGSETSLATATSSMKGQVSNVKAVIHHDVVCPTHH